MFRYPISFLLQACDHAHLRNLHADDADDDLTISIAQQAVAAQQSFTSAREYSYMDGLTLRRVPVSIATPLPHALAHMTAGITRLYVFIANAHDVAKWRLRLHRPHTSLQLKPCTDVSAAARSRVCSSSMAASLAACLSSNLLYDLHHRAHNRFAETIVSRIYSGNLRRATVRQVMLQPTRFNALLAGITIGHDGSSCASFFS
jgi:hypothetical protein